MTQIASPYQAGKDTGISGFRDFKDSESPDLPESRKS
jgi:hypothetical protein